MTPAPALPGIEHPARYTAASPEWYTPAAIVEAARQLMGEIDLDPASCAEANETVRAAKWYGKAENGLAQPWHGRLFINPPGGVTALDAATGKRKRIEPSLVRPFWERLCKEWRAGNVTQAIWVGYSLEQLQVLQSSPDSPLDFPLCFPRSRIAFNSAAGSISPTHANYIAYLPGPKLSDECLGRFVDAFEPFGKVRP